MSRARRSMPRKIMPSNRGTRSRAEAAIELVRLEYERERLTGGIRRATATLEGLEEGLHAVEDRIAQLSELIAPQTGATDAVARRSGPQVFISPDAKRKF